MIRGLAKYSTFKNRFAIFLVAMVGLQQLYFRNPAYRDLKTKKGKGKAMKGGASARGQDQGEGSDLGDDGSQDEYQY